MGSNKAWRSKRVRRALNQAVRDNRVTYFNLGQNNRWCARFEYLIRNTVDLGSDTACWTEVVSTYDIEFTPNEFDYNGNWVNNMGHPYSIDWKTYRWAVRKLSEHHIMQKMSE